MAARNVRVRGLAGALLLSAMIGPNAALACLNRVGLIDTDSSDSQSVENGLDRRNLGQAAMGPESRTPCPIFVSGSPDGRAEDPRYFIDPDFPYIFIYMQWSGNERKSEYFHETISRFFRDGQRWALDGQPPLHILASDPNAPTLLWSITEGSQDSKYLTWSVPEINVVCKFELLGPYSSTR